MTDEQPRTIVTVEGSLIDVIRALQYAAKTRGREPRYVVLGEHQWFRLRAEYRPVAGGPERLLDDAEDGRCQVWDLDIVRVDAPDRLEIGY